MMHFLSAPYFLLRVTTGHEYTIHNDSGIPCFIYNNIREAVYNALPDISAIVRMGMRILGEEVVKVVECRKEVVT